MPDSGTAALNGLLPACAGIGREPGADAPHRRTAPGIPFRRCADAARPAEVGGHSGWPEAHRPVDGQDEHRGALPEAQYQQEGGGQLHLPVPAAESDHRPAEPGLGGGHHLHSDAPWFRLSGGCGGLVQPQGTQLGGLQHADHRCLPGCRQGGDPPLWRARDL